MDVDVRHGRLEQLYDERLGQRDCFSSSSKTWYRRRRYQPFN